MQKLLYTREEARLAVSYKRCAWDYAIKMGAISVVRHGARVLVTAESLENFAKADRPRMAPKPASRVDEPPASAAPEQNGSSVAAKGPRPGRIEYEELRRRRRALAEGE